VKVAFFTEGYEPFINGVVTAINTLRDSLEQRGHEVVIFAPRRRRHEDNDHRVMRLPSISWSTRGYPFLSPLARDTDVLAGGGFDVVHSHHPFSMSRLATRLARKHGLPLVYTFHTMLNEYGKYVPLLPNMTSRWLTSAFLRHCAEVDCVTASTSVVRDFLRQQGVGTRIATVPLGVPAMPISPGGRDRVRRMLGLTSERQTLLYVGRLTKEKRLDLLLRAVARLRNRYEFGLCLVGSGPMEGPLRRLAQRLGIRGRVIFCGSVPHEQIADYYAAADLFVFPSPTDTMGLVLVEAMGAGLPCVAVGKYGPGEVVIDGETGFVVPFDERRFAEATAKLLTDRHLHQRMASAARRRASDFDPLLAGDAMLAAYQETVELCRGNRGRLQPSTQRRELSATCLAGPRE
jgi:glycosyltransferase involved in cell wall biosynthesis